VDAITLLIGIGVGVLLAAVLRALWAYSAAADRRAAHDIDSPFRWETSRGEQEAHGTGPARDRPAEIAELVEIPAVSGPRDSQIPKVEIREPGPEAIRFRPSFTGGDGSPSARVPSTVLKLSQRIVVHLYRLGSSGPAELPTAGATQQGMTEALGARQSSLTKVLLRLVAAGVIEESRSHVRGGSRRLKVYRLTPLGESLARDLRRTGAGAPSAPDSRPEPPTVRAGRP
jgi:DNA-binding MarR family transcriptional regulator